MADAVIDWAKHARAIVSRLGRPAVYTPAAGVSGSPVTVRGIFRRPYQRILDMAESSDPSFFCMVADVPGIKGGATFTVDAVVWRVKPSPEVEPVGGTVFAKLEKTGA